MISSKVIIDKANTLIVEDNLSEINYTQLSSIEPILNNSIEKVATPNDLPLASENKGRMIYVISEKSYFFSDGIEWSDDLDSIPVSIMYSWGDNQYGKLGDNTTIARSSPNTIVANNINWRNVSAGIDHTLGLDISSISYSWGRNTNGQLGDGTTVNKSSPVTVVGGITNWKQVSAGGDHTLALTDDNILYAWGRNTNGQLGDGTTVAKSSPVTVIGGINNWKQVSAGATHSHGITEDGIAYAWGWNSSGRLGDGTTVAKSSPVTVVGGITNWKQISAGYEFSVGLTEDGNVYTWGYNTHGQLGDGTTVAKSSPVLVSGNITSWKSVSASNTGSRSHVVSVTENGVAYAWGRNQYGQLGDNSTTNKSSPVTVVGGITNWLKISVAGQFNAAITQDGIAYTWGRGGQGRLGNITVSDRSSPTSVIGEINTWVDIDAGGGFRGQVLALAYVKGFNET